MAVNHERVEKIENGIIERANRVGLQIVVGRDGSVLRRRRALTVKPYSEDFHTGILQAPEGSSATGEYTGAEHILEQCFFV